MKSTRLLICAAAMAASALSADLSASPITPEQAQEIGARFLSQQNTRRQSRGLRPMSATPLRVQSEYKSPTGATALYLLGNDGSFVMVAADDAAAETVLGYGDSAIDPADMPPAMRWWIGEYAKQVAIMSKTDAKSARIVLDDGLPESVDPLLGFLAWNQGAPYNDNCPEINGKRCYTGCVATSTAQVMRYHKYPAQGQGSWSYTWTGTTPAQTFSTDFSSHTYDWENMPLHYGKSSTAAENAAVAQLMNDVGVAVSMDYGTSESGAASVATVPALIENFGYDKGAKFLFRSAYGIELWEETLRSELAAGRPVIYAGQSAEGGHQFVCDGYDSNGYFHINWGWAGMCNGYFLTTALVPQGVGAGGFAAGYDYNQSIITGIQPDKGSDAACGASMLGQYFYTPDGVNYALEALYMTFFSGTQTFDVGLTFCTRTQPIVNAEATVTIESNIPTSPRPIERGGSTIPESELFAEQFQVNPVTEANLPDGTYYVYPVAKPSSASEWTIIPCKQSQYFELTVSDGQITVAEQQQAQVELVSLEMPKAMPIGKQTAINGSLRALGREFYNTVTAAMFSAQGDTIAISGGDLIDIPAQTTGSFSIPLIVPPTTPAGNYTVKLYVAGQQIADDYTVEATSQAVEINSANFPDQALRSAVAEAFDKDGDSVLSDTELYQARELNAMNRGITDATGIGLLYNLASLYLDGNDINEIDISGLTELAVLGLESNHLTEINTAANTKLQFLRLNYNKLSAVDISRNTMLFTLLIAHNPILALDLSSAEALTTFSAGSEATVQLSDGNDYDLSSAPGMDTSKISNLQGATIEGSMLTFTAPEASYDYETGNPEMPLLSVKLKADNFSSIGSVVTDPAKAEYFNLQGQRVFSPTPGHIYIKVTGEETSKAIF